MKLHSFAKILSGTTIGAALAALPSLAQATLTVQLTDGAFSVLCADGGLCDASSSSGNITLNNVAIGGYSFTATIGISKPQIGSAIEPSLQLTNVSLSGLGSGSLSVLVSDTDFLGPTSPMPYQFSLAGTTTGSNVSAAAYLDSSNTLFATTTALDQFSPFSGASFSDTHALNLSSPTTPYSLTIAALLSPAAGTQMSVSSLSAQLTPTPVPLPAAALLFGTGFLGLVGTRLRRRPG